MLVSSVGMPIAEIHIDVLQVLSNAFNNGTLVEAIPEVIKAMYLGPVINKYKTNSSAESTLGQQSKRDSNILLHLLLFVSIISY